MRPGRIVAAVVASVAALVGLAALLVGAGVLVVTAIARDDDGYFHTSTEPLGTGTYAIVSEEVDLGARPDPGDWTPDGWATVRLRAESSSDTELFVGIGPEDEVAGYLADVAHAVVHDVDTNPFSVEYTTSPGTRTPSSPVDETWWVASATGRGPLQLEWDVEPGRWAVVVMNADATRGVDVDASIGVRVPALPWIGLGLLIAGMLLLPLAIAAIVWSTAGPRSSSTVPGLAPPQSAATLPATAPALAGRPPAEATAVAVDVTVAVDGYPVRVTGRLDEPLSRWLWLVKWILAIPHFVVLVFLWIGLVFVTLIAAVAILFTGRYPSPLFRYSSGVLRWTWRVSFYASGALATDRYPPFTLGPADYPAELEIDEPARLHRLLWLVKWLLAIPHLLVLALLGGGAGSIVLGWGDDGDRGGTAAPGLIAVLVLVAAVVLLFTGRYPRGVFAFVMGCNRWVLRVVAYLALLTDRYPPFRLDQGGEESESS